jgi:hypothetical protein
MTYSRTIHKRCATCNSDHNHDFTLVVLEHEGQFYMGTGPFETEDEVVRAIDKAAEMVEAQNEKNTA